MTAANDRGIFRDIEVGDDVHFCGKRCLVTAVGQNAKGRRELTLVNMAGKTFTAFAANCVLLA